MTAVKTFYVFNIRKMYVSRCPCKWKITGLVLTSYFTNNKDICQKLDCFLTDGESSGILLRSSHNVDVFPGLCTKERTQMETKLLMY